MPTTIIGSQTIYYDEYGSGDPIILIPGLGANRLSWAKQILPLSNKYHIINIDNRDAGNSGQCSGSYDMNDMTNDIAGLIENLQLKSVCIIGTSMGSYIAQYLALEYPQYVKKWCLFLLLLVEQHMFIQNLKYFPYSIKIQMMICKRVQDDYSL